MLIVADENIPLLDELFANLGEIRRYPGRTISAEQVRDAELLLVRSVTRVDQALLAGSRVRFVGTCTIGTDHLDLAYLEAKQIGWASAPGCNAQGVIDYVLGVLLCLAERSGQDLSKKCYGIVGAGQVGGRLQALLTALGWPVKVCDPPRAAREGGNFVLLQEIIEQCDVISLHTPLDASTRHLLSAQHLAQLKPGAWLINASRGAVVDNHALKSCLLARPDLQVALDVWEGEPLLDAQLAQLCQLATPHIAGYSLDGKLRGTWQIYQAFCTWAYFAPSQQLEALLPESWLAELSISAKASPEWLLKLLSRAVYDPRTDDAALRLTLSGTPEQRRLAFDALRKHYPLRREIAGLKVCVQGAAPQLNAVLAALKISRAENDSGPLGA